MTKMFMYAYNPASEGASELAGALKIKKIKHEGSKYKGNNNKIVINWGSSKIDNPEILKSKILNLPELVSLCSNKLRFFNKIAGTGVNIPDWTNDRKTAFQWVEEGILVVARTVLNGHSGEGIVLMSKDDPKTLVNAPLYTKYIPKKEEYRVHIIHGDVVDVQRKALRNGYVEEHGPPNYKIRNHGNGFIYMRNDIKVPDQVRDQALNAIRVIGLDFGAVDIIFNEKQNKAYVLEINTAPGLEGQSVENYAKGLSIWNR